MQYLHYSVLSELVWIRYTKKQSIIKGNNRTSVTISWSEVDVQEHFIKQNNVADRNLLAAKIKITVFKFNLFLGVVFLLRERCIL